MRITALILLASFSYVLLQAQGISGIVRDSQGKFLARASVALQEAADSAPIKLGLTDDNGQYSFSSIPPGNYFITVSHVSYLPRKSAVFTVTAESAARIPAIELIHSSRDLQQAQVTAFRPLVEARPDRIILNVEHNINASGEDALALLRIAPGISIDNNNNISLSGKNGVQVYVDGRPTYLSGSSLAQYLGTLQSSSIESIEIISNPSSRYEAAGGAGIINIRLKKNTSLGTNVIAGAGYNLGTFSKYNASLGFNHRDQHLNLFGDYTYFNGTKVANTVYNRTLPDTLLLQQAAYTIPTVSQTFHLGLDYFLDRHSSLGFLIGGALTTDSFKSNSNTRIVYRPANTTDRLLIADSRTSELQDDYNFNLNYRYAGTGGRELDLDADYALYRLRKNQFQPNNYFDSTGQYFLYGDRYNILSPTNIDIYSFKADYTANWLGGRLGLGAKVSYVTSANIFQQYDGENTGWVFDTLSGDNFNYKENINAAYLSYSRSFKQGLSIQAGLRAENTNGRGSSAGWQQITADYSPYDSTWLRHYTDLFPNTSLTWKQWTFNYSRRIDRPSYQDLNPFVFMVDDYTFSQGNTRLKPQYANNFSLTWSYKYALSATLSYSHISDLFTTVPDTIDRSRTVTSSVNLTSQSIAGANVSYSVQYKWYSAFLNINGFYAVYRANFGVGKNIDLNVFNTTITSQHNIQLGKGWSASLTQYYTSRNIWTGTLRARPMWSLEAGLQKTLFGGRAMVKTSVSDIFYTLRWSVTSNYSGQSLYSSGTTDTRQLKINFTYRFGNRQVKAAPQHQTGAEEESKRVNPGTH
jgi:outer membrane beta-barrel protein/carboxypeptidase family protein/TonB-dependent receptor-like protein